MMKELMLKHQTSCRGELSNVGIACLASVLSTITIISGASLFAANSFANDTTSTSATATVTVGSACTLDVTEDVAHTAKGTPGTTTSDIGLTTFKTICNDGSGYAIYAVGYSGLEYGNTKMLATISGEPSSTNDIVTGTSTSGNASNWAMKLNAVAGTYAPIIVGSSLDSERQSTTPDFSGYTAVPNTYTRIAYRNSATDTITGSSIQSTYRTYIATTQPAGTYEGKVKYTLVHPAGETPLQPQAATSGCINYFANASNAVGTMGCQSVADGNTITLLASNFSRSGYGFAGWSDAYDYATNPNANLYGPQEDITVPTGTTANGLSLYAIWIKSEGSIQDTTKVAEVCTRLTQSGPSVTKTLASVSALTDQRDNDTYAIAKLADGNCWMIENLRLDNTAAHNSDGSLAQGYDASFAGLADPETPWSSSSTTANSLYSTDGSTDRTISGSDQGYRFPRYNNANTPATATDRPSNPTNNSATNSTSKAGMYSYGNYYTWAAAIADTTYYSKKNQPIASTSICPTGWMIPQGNTAATGFGKLDTDMGGTGATQNNRESSNRWREYPNNFLISGSVGDSGFILRGSNGNYWSSSTAGSVGSYSLSFATAHVHPGITNSARTSGRTIRCFNAST